jgi:hypothetical protein
MPVIFSACLENHSRHPEVKRPPGLKTLLDLPAPSPYLNNKQWYPGNEVGELDALYRIHHCALDGGRDSAQQAMDLRTNRLLRVGRAP